MRQVLHINRQANHFRNFLLPPTEKRFPTRIVFRPRRVACAALIMLCFSFVRTELTMAQIPEDWSLLCPECPYPPAPIQSKTTIPSSYSQRRIRYTYHWILYYDLYTTLSAFHYLNPQSSQEMNSVYYYYNLDIKSNLSIGQWRWDLYGFNDYGVRHFPDSLTIKTQDQVNWKNALSFPIKGKKLYVSVSASTQTRIWNTYAYRPSPVGTNERYLYEGFMSPGTIVYSGGLTAELTGGTVLQIGLGSSKVTRIRNQAIFESRNETKIAGIEKGKHRLAEWGLSLTATIPTQKLSRMLRWECFAQGFAPAAQLQKLSSYQLDVNNVLHLLMLRYMRISLRTKFTRPPGMPPLIHNHLSVGFYLNNRP